MRAYRFARGGRRERRGGARGEGGGVIKRVRAPRGAEESERAQIRNRVNRNQVKLVQFPCRKWELGQTVSADRVNIH